MTTQKNILDHADVAVADLSAKQYYVVKLGSTGYNVVSTANDTGILGILQNTPENGEPCDVTLMGLCKAKAGGAITVGQAVKVNASGLLVAVDDPDDHIMGYCATKSGASTNDIFQVELVPVAGSSSGDYGLPSSTYCEIFEDFLGNAVNTTSGPWAISDTSSGGTPTYVNTAGVGNDGRFVVTLDSTSEAEIVDLYWGDKLPIDIDKGPIAYFRLQFPSMAANETVCWGLASARNATLNNVAANLWFKIEGDDGALGVVVESDDGATDHDDKVGFTASAATDYEWKIDCTTKTDVRFYYRATLGGTWTRLASGTTFTMANYTAGLQPFVRVAKASGTTQPTINIDYIRLRWARS